MPAPMIRCPTGQLTVAVWSRALLYAVPPILICHPAMGLAQIANACTLKASWNASSSTPWAKT
jgi:hypothetical protein